MADRPEPRDWWQVHPDDWQPIETYPGDGRFYVLANKDKSRTWLCSDATPSLAGSHELKAGTEDELVDGHSAAFWAEA